MTILNLPENKTYEPVGKCIYCGDASNPDLLTREHILPLGLSLDGTHVLPKASCPNCSRTTSAIETFCLQRMFIDARTHLGLKSRAHRRNKKGRPPLRVGHLGTDGEVKRWQELTSGKHPFALYTLAFPPAGILAGRPPDAQIQMQICVCPSPAFAERMSDLPTDVAVYGIVDAGALARMLAKIAHAITVANYGLGSFRPFLPEVILQEKNVFHYVGGAPIDSTRRTDVLHSVAVEEQQNGLIIVYLRLFTILGAPAYRIVVGSIV